MFSIEIYNYRSWVTMEMYLFRDFKKHEHRQDK